MPTPQLLECVPNFSEGRNLKIVQQVADAAAARGCRIADVHSDPDHHRSVITMFGEPDSLLEGCLAATKVCAEEIDLSSHLGVHPRLGAMDVIPFVPLRGAPMQIAVETARRTAETISRELAVPCFLYEEASFSDTHRSLPEIRTRAFVSLSPDYGDRPHRSAGATVVGARGLLVAFNVNLATDQAEFALRIAKKIRQVGDGITRVRALGFALPHAGVTQISMNMLEPLATTVADVFDEVARLARREGVEILNSEIVGLVPKDSLGGRSASDLMLSSEPKILEAEVARAVEETSR